MKSYELRIEESEVEVRVGDVCVCRWQSSDDEPKANKSSFPSQQRLSQSSVA